MSDLKLGQLVADHTHGCYGWIRGFKTPWVWVIEPYTGEGNGASLALELGEKTYTQHFTNLGPLDAAKIQRVYNETKADMKWLEDFAKLAGITLT